MGNKIYKINDEFEEELCKYTGAKWAVVIDSLSNAIFLALTYENIKDQEISIPSRTYPSIPCEIIHAGGKVKFEKTKGKYLEGAYQLKPTNVWDYALRFTADMYVPGTHACLSFTGPYKHLKLSKGGAILTDNYDAYLWFRRARYSGRREVSYHGDHFDMIGWNFYLMPELGARGLLMMSQFYVGDMKVKNKDLKLSYPDLSKFKIYTEANR